jgi:DNA primase
MNLDKLNTLKISGATGIDIMLDADEAGQLAAKKLEKLCEKAELPTRNIKLTTVNDPGELTFNSVQKLRKSLYGISSNN